MLYRSHAINRYEITPYIAPGKFAYHSLDKYIFGNIYMKGSFLNAAFFYSFVVILLHMMLRSICAQFSSRRMPWLACENDAYNALSALIPARQSTQCTAVRNR